MDEQPSPPSERPGSRPQLVVVHEAEPADAIGYDVSTLAAAEPKPEYNLRLLHSLARWILETHPDRYEHIARRAGLEPSILSGGNQWASLEQLESVLASVRALVPDDEAFKQACSYRLAEGYGPWKFLLQAASPQLVFTQATKNFEVVSAVSSYEVAFPERSRMIATYRSALRESRLMCLSRQAHCVVLPTLWGLPPAHLTETGCIANGDAACTYRVRLYEQRRWTPVVLGALLGVGMTWVVAGMGFSVVPMWIALPLLFSTIAHVYELRRTNRANLATGAEIQHALRREITEHSEARREVLDLHRRQREWSRLLEEQVHERTHALEDVLQKIRHLQAMRDISLRGVSHDLRNPLTVLEMETVYLRELLPKLDEDAKEILESHEHAVSRMHKLLDDLMDMAVQNAVSIRHSPEPLVVADITDRLRRRLKALVYGRDIRVSCFATREAPETLVVDPLLFDRVLDNLLTNAAKYTARGSIVVEVDGTPGYLTIKVSDTGRGIEPDQLRRIFEGRIAKSDAPNSRGVGLTVVVGLMGDIGGQLEVISKPGQGTTFWVHFPSTPLQSPGDELYAAQTRSAQPHAIRIRKSDAPR